VALTPYYIKIAPKAAEQIKALPLKNRKLIFRLIEALAINPRPPGAKKIDGMTGLYCEALNGLRLIYKIEEQEILILLAKQ
jgi:mRNA interferase RelE/StbE